VKGSTLKRLLLFAAAVCGSAGLAVAGLSAGPSYEAAPSIRVMDNCACGGSWPRFLGCGYGIGTWDGGPGASPRFYVGPCV
jgi:hypothetical protein